MDGEEPKPMTARTSPEPIAILGFALRFPAGINDPDQFWGALISGRNLVTRIGEERWASGDLQHPRRAEPGRSVTFAAGTLNGIEGFDAAFFGISPREAELLDPQQRLLLELAWESFENAGVKPSTVAGSDCGVFVGISSLDYGMRQLDDLAGIGAHSMTGNTLSVAANRLSYTFDLHGPSIAIDTACSSSLVALHRACVSLRAREVSAALVGGVNLLLHPYPFIGFTKASMLSAEGLCRSFSADADGYVRAEGGAVMLLKPLEAARRNGDRVIGIIRGSGMNNDGARKPGLTIPSAEGQTELMQRVLDETGLAPTDIDYIEAHGTGTKIGDPIEAQSIGRVYGAKRPRPLPIGSVKSNLGHMEPASGLAGLIKALLVLQHGIVPPSLHAERLNPAIDFAALGIEVAREPLSLSRLDRPLRTAVNSFGFGGVNAHVIIEAGSTPTANQIPAAIPSAPVPLILTAHDTEALRELARRYLPLLGTPASRVSVAHATWTRRELLAERLALPNLLDPKALDVLDRFATGETHGAWLRERALVDSARVAYVYAGNGAQWTGMGRRLIAESPIFAARINEIAATLVRHDGPDILEALNSDDPATYQETSIAQPALFALQVATTELLRDCGLQSNVAIGHSVGEIAAAWSIGALDLESACRLVVVRSRAQSATRGTGRMAAVGLSAESLRSRIEKLGIADELEIAADNAPRSATVSGTPRGLAVLRENLPGVFFRELDLDYAFHSQWMDSIRASLLSNLAGLRTQRSRGRFYSTVLCGPVESDALRAEYWWHNVRDPVRFGPTVSRMIADGLRVFVEIGPHAILQRYINESFSGSNADGRALATSPRREETLENVRTTVLRATLLGCPVDASQWFPASSAPHLPLPNYPWQRQRLWNCGTTEKVGLLDRKARHPLLGYRLAETPAGWENHLDPIKHPLIAEHKVGGAMVLPGAAYVELALAASREWYGSGTHVLEDLDIRAPIVFDGQHARTIRVIFSPSDLRFRIEGRQRLSADPWTLHAQGRLLGAGPVEPRAAIPAPLSDGPQIEGAELYRRAAARGLEYGPTFRGIASIAFDREALRATLDWTCCAPSGEHYLLHPAVLDQAFQSLLAAADAWSEAPRDSAFLPVGFGRVTLWRPGTAVTTVAARSRWIAHRSALIDFELIDSSGQLVASIEGARFRSNPIAASNSLPTRWTSRIHLVPLPGDGGPLPPSDIPAEAAAATLQTVQATANQAHYFDDAAPLLELLPIAYARDALRGSSSEGIERWRRGPPLQRWLLAQAQTDGLIAKHADGIRVIEDFDLPPTDTIWNAALAACPAAASALLRIGQVGRRLVNGESLEPDTGVTDDVAPNNATASPSEVAATRAAVDAIDALLRRWPIGRRVRILDIGARNDTLQRVLRSGFDSGDVDYVIARADHDGPATFRDGVKSIGFDPTTFSFESDSTTPRRFDIVLIDHQLHWATQPARALASIDDWLADDGVLLVTERYPDRASDFANGAAVSWWRDESSIPQGRLRTPEQWTELLKRQGWRDLREVRAPTIDTLGLGSAVLIARPAPRTPSLQARSPRHWALVPDHPGWDPLVAALAERLRASGERVSCGVGEDAADHWVLFPTVPTGAEDAAAIAEILSVLRNRLVEVRRRTEMGRVWIVTRGGALIEGGASDTPTLSGAAVWGLGRVATNELHPVRLSLVDLPDTDPALAPRLAGELLLNDDESEVVLTAQTRHGVRLRSTPEPRLERDSTRPWRLESATPGRLRHLHWVTDDRRALADDEIEIEACAAGLNFRDVMYAMGLISDHDLARGFAGATLGLEVSGRVSRCGRAVSTFRTGDEVLAFAGASFASHVIAPVRSVLKKPPHWTHAEAATVPTVFFTVWYALLYLARLQRDERILIHGAAGGIGIAAIQVARHLGARVIATAGHSTKREFVQLLGTDHVLDSRDPHFEQAVLDLTDGEGVDVVLNSLAGEAITRNLLALKPFGRFIELGKRDFIENTTIGLRPLRQNISYFAVDADQLMALRPALATTIFNEVMAAFEHGHLSPLPHRVFSADDVIEAFRHMQQARHIGKIVVDLTHRPSSIQGTPVAPFQCDPNGTYLVTGGLSGFGYATACWLAERGARHLALAGRRGPDTPGSAERLDALRDRGVDARAFACDVGDREAIAATLNAIHTSMPALRGVVHAAMVLDDGLVANLDTARFERVLGPKVDGATLLHELTRDLRLDLFLMFSSATTVFGNIGQANYVAANAALEALARLRRREGLPACAVAWGPIGDVGVLTRDDLARDALEARLGVVPVDAKTMLSALDRILADTECTPAVCNIDWRALRRWLPTAQSPRFEGLQYSTDFTSGAVDGGDLREQLRGLPIEDARRLLIDALVAEVAEILRLPPDRIPPGQPVYDLGMDSLMAVELSVALEKRLAVTIPPMILQDNPSLTRVADRLLTSFDDERPDEETQTHRLIEVMTNQNAEEAHAPIVSDLAQEVRESLRAGTRLIG